MGTSPFAQVGAKHRLDRVVHETSRGTLQGSFTASLEASLDAP